MFAKHQQTAVCNDNGGGGFHGCESTVNSLQVCVLWPAFGKQNQNGGTPSGYLADLSWNACLLLFVTAGVC